MASQRLENIDHIRAVDAFPHPQINPEGYATYMQQYYTVVWRNDDAGTNHETQLGYMRRDVCHKIIEQVPKEIRGEVNVDESKGTVSLFQDFGSTPEERTPKVHAVSLYLRDHQVFPILKGWRNELWPVYGDDGKLLYSMERVTLSLLGAMRFGVHMTGYVKSPASKHGIKIWVPKRAVDKSSFPGMLDNTVAGGLMTDEDPFECIVREADEEASLPESVVRQGAQSVGTITYIYITDDRTGEAGYVYPECQWVYDLELPADGSVVPKPKDGEVESFRLCTVDEIREDMASGRFKPNCAAVLVDFFIRHGLLTQQNEPHLDEIDRRLHRVISFPGPHLQAAS
ncbi:hypothetical protein ACKVWC_005192 [Pyricularia oryzae]